MAYILPRAVIVAPPQLAESIVAEVPMRQLRHRMQDSLNRLELARPVPEEDVVF